jgi:hypothetical protein
MEKLYTLKELHEQQLPGFNKLFQQWSESGFETLSDDLYLDWENQVVPTNIPYLDWVDFRHDAARVYEYVPLCLRKNDQQRINQAVPIRTTLAEEFFSQYRDTVQYLQNKLKYSKTSIIDFLIYQVHITYIHRTDRAGDILGHDEYDTITIDIIDECNIASSCILHDPGSFYPSDIQEIRQNLHYTPDDFESVKEYHHTLHLHQIACLFASYIREKISLAETIMFRAATELEESLSSTHRFLSESDQHSLFTSTGEEQQ